MYENPPIQNDLRVLISFYAMTANVERSEEMWKYLSSG